MRTRRLRRVTAPLRGNVATGDFLLGVILMRGYSYSWNMLRAIKQLTNGTAYPEASGTERFGCEASPRVFRNHRKGKWGPLLTYGN